MTTAAVTLWGTRIGAVSWRDGLGWFEYTPAFLASGIEVAPFTMPLGESRRGRVWSFPALRGDTFRGLPGLVADALPDRFGNAVIDAWIAGRGVAREDFDPVKRLCYVGSRGSGALEFEPAELARREESDVLDVAALVELASLVLTDREAFAVRLGEEGEARTSAVNDILRVGTSAGGARAKAVILWNPDTGEVRSGQVSDPAATGRGLTHWILKFDGVAGNRDRELLDPEGYGLIEYAYHLMAVAAGIEMTECRLLREGGRHHFATRRFDRTDDGKKLHMQTLCALAHLDFELAGAHSYEQAMQLMRRLGLPLSALEEQLRRAAFNVLARNQDDHTKNIAFLMDKRGRWSLSPAYDVTYAYNPAGEWTGQHQMMLNGKRDAFELEDFVEVGRTVGLKRGRARAIVEEVAAVVERWPDFAAEAGVEPEDVARIQRTLRRIGTDGSLRAEA